MKKRKKIILDKTIKTEDKFSKSKQKMERLISGTLKLARAIKKWIKNYLILIMIPLLGIILYDFSILIKNGTIKDIGSLFGGIFGGLLTLIGVILTMRYQNNKEKKRLKDDFFKNRPQFCIASKTDQQEDDSLFLINIIKNSKNEIDYTKMIVNDTSNLLEQETVFKNIGNTNISKFFFIADKEYCVLFNDLKALNIILSKKHIICSTLIAKSLLINQEYKFKIYHKDNFEESYLKIIIKDFNGNYWKQLFSIDFNFISGAQFITETEYVEYTKEINSVIKDDKTLCELLE